MFWVPESLHYVSIGISFLNYRSDLSLSCFKTPAGSVASGRGFKCSGRAPPYLFAILSYHISVLHLPSLLLPSHHTPCGDSHGFISLILHTTLLLRMSYPVGLSVGRIYVVQETTLSHHLCEALRDFLRQKQSLFPQDPHSVFSIPLAQHFSC